MMKIIPTIEPTQREVRKFGFTFFILLLAVAAILLYRGKASWPWFAGASLVFVIPALIRPLILRPVYIGWMTFAHLLAWVNTRVILGLVFYLIFTPIGLISRIFGKDLLGEKFSRGTSSYWIRKERGQSDPKRCEQMF